MATVTPHPLWAGRTVIVATQHEKERALGPLLLSHLGLPYWLVNGFDTDQFGTFSGEVEREDDPVITLRKKIKRALELSGGTLGLGNEGSFGPHPQMPWVPGDQELVMLVDTKNQLEVMEVVTSTETNYNSLAEVASWEELENFANLALFPSHGLIVKTVGAETFNVIKKGITDWDTLRQIYDHHQKQKLSVETDMRANFNPTRMRVIEQAGLKLMQQLNTLCPQCQWPAFGDVTQVSGLPCENCSRPTRLTKLTITTCQHCGYREEKPSEQLHASAQYCDFCNP